uniref:NAC domain-containing protein n=1 Tax=Setaria viridis TaxID=4556 RepID=A0A4U6W8G9_SETVI|nr:hypothetical protein SEVIR_1G126800v2 [Setaria viridis]
MSTKAAQILGHPPGINFRPDDDELVEFFLLPRLRGEPSWFPGVVVIDDDSAANTLPWNLLKRHGMADDGNAYFFVHTNDVVARQDRYCPGDGTWVSQRQESGSSCICGETIKWKTTNLNLQMGRGKKGSMGWVMHEYTLTEPPCPFLKICHVTFAGHGKWRKRVPDDESGCQATGEPASKRARVAAAAAANSGSSTCAYGSTAPAIDQGYGADHASGDPAHQTRISDQELSVAAAHASAYQQEHLLSFPIHQGISPSNQELIDGTYLPPCMELEELRQTTDQPVQSSFWSFPYSAATGGAELFLEVPTIQQHQPMVHEASTAEYQGISETAHQQLMVQETTGTAEHQLGLDEQEQLFWKSLHVDIENIVC